MRTLQAAPATALRRDLGLLWRIAGMVLEYVVAGGRLRREYRRREARGEVLWVDAAGPTRHREEPLRR
ncbi:MAG TPA: hypothetical protein VII13_01445 [Vicinamibacteria bacterium]|jgi:hypothetical protein